MIDGQFYPGQTIQFQDGEFEPDYTAPIAIGTVGTYGSDADSTSYTATGLTAIATGERAVVALYGRNNVNALVSGSPTIGGVAMTPLHSLNDGVQLRIDFYLGPVSQSGDVAVTYTQPLLRFGCALWPVSGLLSATPFDTGNSQADPMADTMNCPINGAIIGAAFDQNSGAGFAWTGITENFERQIVVAGENGYFSGASSVFTTTQTGLSVQCNAGAFVRGMILVALR